MPGRAFDIFLGLGVFRRLGACGTVRRAERNDQTQARAQRKRCEDRLYLQELPQLHDPNCTVQIFGRVSMQQNPEAQQRRHCDWRRNLWELWA
jgi:hypothetical protein